MFVSAGRLRGPRQAAVRTLQDSTVGARCPSGDAGRADRVKMVLRVGPCGPPFVTTVVGHEDAATPADDHGRTAIFDVDRGKRKVQRKSLSLPGESAVLCAKDRVVGTDGKTGELIFCEMDRIERISLRQRILPDPALCAAILGVGAHEGEKHETYETYGTYGTYFNDFHRSHTSHKSHRSHSS